MKKIVVRTAEDAISRPDKVNSKTTVVVLKKIKRKIIPEQMIQKRNSEGVFRHELSLVRDIPATVLVSPVHSVCRAWVKGKKTWVKT